MHHISDGDFYLIIPRDPSATVRLYKNDMETDAKTLFYEQTNGDAFVIGCNVSDIFPDVTVSITSGGGDGGLFAVYLAQGWQRAGRRTRAGHYAHFHFVMTERAISPGANRTRGSLLYASGSSVLAQTTAPTRAYPRDLPLARRR